MLGVNIIDQNLIVVFVPRSRLFYLEPFIKNFWSRGPFADKTNLVCVYKEILVERTLTLIFHSAALSISLGSLPLSRISGRRPAATSGEPQTSNPLDFSSSPLCGLNKKKQHHHHLLVAATTAVK